MKKYKIHWENTWEIEANSKEEALEEVQENMCEATYDYSQFDVEEV